MAIQRPWEFAIRNNIKANYEKEKSKFGEGQEVKHRCHRYVEKPATENQHIPCSNICLLTLPTPDKWKTTRLNQPRGGHTAFQQGPHCLPPKVASNNDTQKTQNGKLIDMGTTMGQTTLPQLVNNR